MKTEELFEGWGLGLTMLRDAATTVAGDEAMSLGGSLADDLGHPQSDINVYCFAEGSGGCEHWVALDLAGRRVVMHPVPDSTITALGESGHGLLTDTTCDASIHTQWLPFLHALSRGVPINRRATLAAMADRAAAELYPYHFGTTALAAFACLAEEACALVEDGD